MSPTLTTFLVELVNFLLLVSLVGWLLFRPVRSTLQARQAAEKRQTDELATRAAEAERLQVELERRSRTFEEDMAELRQQHVASANEEAAAIQAHAREAAARERDSVQRVLGHLERAEVGRLSAAVAAATRESVARLLTTLDVVDLETGLMRVACRQLEMLGSRPLGAVLVESPRALDGNQETAIRTAVDGHATSVEFRITPHLRAGIRVTTAQGLVDSSAIGIAAQAEAALMDAFTRQSSETVP